MINDKRMIKIIRNSLFIGIFTYLFSFTNPVLAKTMENGTRKSSEGLPFYWMIIIVGGCIGITLSYVSWRKYKGEKRATKDNNVD